MGGEVRTRMPVEARRAQLLQLGGVLFSERPYDEISVDEIAERASISKGLLYHYFPSKRELYIACVRRAVEDMLAACEPAANVQPQLRFQASLEAFIDYVERNMAAFRNLLRGGSDNHPEIEQILSDMRHRQIHQLAASLGIEAPDAVTRYCLLGYVGFASYTCVAWATAGGLPRQALRTLLSDQLRSAITSAAALTEDPAIRERLGALAPFLVTR